MSKSSNFSVSTLTLFANEESVIDAADVNSIISVPLAPLNVKSDIFVLAIFTVSAAVPPVMLNPVSDTEATKLLDDADPSTVVNPAALASAPSSTVFATFASFNFSKPDT